VVTLKHTIPSSEDGWVTHKANDILGNDIEILIQEKKPSGNYKVTCYAEVLPSGIFSPGVNKGNLIYILDY